MRNNNYLGVFYMLLQAGLWEKDVQLLQYGRINFRDVIQLAEEQSVVGLVTAGLEHVKDAKIPHDKLIPFIGRTLQIEQRNKAMNEFIAKLMNLLNENGIKALLVKGQGVAQCYERPLWRACGDVDLLLDDENYRKAKELLIPLASSVEPEDVRNKHQGMHIKGFVLELHGKLYSGLSSRIDKEIDNLQQETFLNGQVRSWQNGNTYVSLLKIENDVFYVFTHILQHFYKEGVGLRQICDWCRLLCTNRSDIDVNLLKSRIFKAGIMSEWRAFAAFAVYYLGMPVDAMPFFNDDDKHNANLLKKSKRINKFILQVGNMGHNRDMSYFATRPYLIRKFLSFKRRIKDIINHASIFPLDSVRFLPYIIYNGLKSAVKEEVV